MEKKSFFFNVALSWYVLYVCTTFLSDVMRAPQKPSIFQFFTLNYSHGYITSICNLLLYVRIVIVVISFSFFIISPFNLARGNSFFLSQNLLSRFFFFFHLYFFFFSINFSSIFYFFT